MSLLDDVSVVVTPNGYKAGRLYGVLPVPTVGNELVIDGSFPLGTTAWTVGTGWSLANGYAESDGTTDNLDQNINLTINQLYKATITVSNMTTGTLSYRLGGSSLNEILSISEDGEYTAYGVAGGASLRLRSQSSFNGRVTNISVKEWTGSDMDVTRATAATRVDENGLVNYAQVLGSEEVFNGDFATNISGWTTNTSRGSYAWDNGRAKITNDAADGYPNMSQDITTEIGKAYKVTATVEIGTATLAEVRIYDGAILGNQQLTSDGEIEFRFTAVGTTPKLLLYLFEAGNTGHYCYFDNVSVKQEDRNNVPRIDYTGGGCPHILAEPQRTNLITYSEDFSDSSWSKSNCTVGSESVSSPSGVIGVSSVTNTSIFGRISTIKNLTNAVSYSYSFWCKNIDITTPLSIHLNNSGITLDTFTPTSEWVKYVFTWTSSSTITETIAIQDRIGSALGSYMIWGAQLEEGSYPTSYIPTSGSTVTRNQDLFTRDGISSLINSTEGCVFGEGNFAESNSSSYNYFVSLSDGTPNNRLEIRQSVSNLQFLWRVATYQSQISTSGLDVSGNFKFALNYSTANIKFYVNGNLIGTINTPTLWSANTLNRLAFDNGAGGDILSGKVRQLQVYNTALTDNQLIQLTGEAGTHFFESYSEMAETLTYTIQ